MASGVIQVALQYEAGNVAFMADGGAPLGHSPVGLSVVVCKSVDVLDSAYVLSSWIKAGWYI